MVQTKCLHHGCPAAVSCTLAFSRDTYPRVVDLDAIHYRISLEIQDTGEEIAGETEIQFAFNADSVQLATYCMAFGAANFAVVNAGSWNSIPLSYYLYPKDREHGIQDFGRALKMIEFYSGLIGPYPYEKLALVQSTTLFGGMENSSAIFFNEKIFDGRGKLETLVAHEIAHQWFGDSVTEADWHHVWLSESFATYFGAVFFEHADGRDGFVKTMLGYKANYLKQYARDPRPMYDPEITDPFRLLNANNYLKGAWLLHMLRHLMGDEKVFAGIRDYYDAFRDRNALTADFQRVMERHAGRPLD